MVYILVIAPVLSKSLNCLGDMTMNSNFRVPPLSPTYLTSPDVLAERLKPLIGTEFHLTLFPRTNGSKLRKLIAETLATCDLPPPCPKNLYTIVPTKGKGVPRILLEYIDTYIVTTGKQYNLQVWNRNPTGNAALVEYASGEKLSAKEQIIYPYWDKA